MLELLNFILINAGISIILTRSKLFAPARVYLSGDSKWRKDFLECPLCMGWWSSIYVSLFYLHLIDINTIFFNCFTGAITSYLIYSIISR